MIREEELVKADFEAKAQLLEAERSHIRSQINLLEAQLKQNSVKGQELEFQWNRYVQSLQAAQNAAATHAESDKPTEAKVSKKK